MEDERGKEVRDKGKLYPKLSSDLAEPWRRSGAEMTESEQRAELGQSMVGGADEYPSERRLRDEWGRRCRSTWKRNMENLLEVEFLVVKWCELRAGEEPSGEEGGEMRTTRGREVRGRGGEIVVQHLLLASSS
eukprot:748243-Hanusia_phi.AAC.3